MRLFGRKGPLGDLTCVNAKGHAVVRFKALSIIAYLAAAGLIEVRLQSTRPERATE